MATFESSLKSKLIYVFAINDERHKDCLKIGETTIDEDDGSDLFNNAESLKEIRYFLENYYVYDDDEKIKKDYERTNLGNSFSFVNTNEAAMNNFVHSLCIFRFLEMRITVSKGKMHTQFC